MSTKVKGDKIKESSIPLSALSDKVKKELDKKLGLYGYYGSLGKDVKNIDTDMYHMGKVFVVIGNNFYEVPKGTYDLSELHGGPSATLNVYAKEMYLSLELQDSSGYWNDIAIYKGYNKPPQETPNWNAQPGEAGYIENKTHYVDLTYFEHLTINKNDFDLSFDGSYWIAEYKTLLNEEQLFVYCSAEGKEFYSPIGDSEIKLPNSIYVKRIDVFSDDGDFVGIKLVVRNGKIDEEFRGESFYFADIWSYPHIKELPSIYLPDTIVKTTPQTLSNTDKNQALANLGLGNIPRYIDITSEQCNRFGETLTSDELFNMFGDVVFDDTIPILGVRVKNRQGTYYMYHLPLQSLIYDLFDTKRISRMQIGNCYISEEDYGFVVLSSPSIFIMWDEDNNVYKTACLEY